MYFQFDQDGSLAGAYWSDILVKDTRNLQQKLDGFSRRVGGDPGDMQASNNLPGVVNTMTNPTRSLGLLAAMAAFAALVPAFALKGFHRGGIVEQPGVAE